jgi:hypothetical protein
MLGSFVHSNFTVRKSHVHFFLALSFSYFIGGLNPAIVLILEMVTFLTADNVPNVALLYTLVIIVGSLLGSVGASIFFNKIYFKHMKTWRNFN